MSDLALEPGNSRIPKYLLAERAVLGAIRKGSFKPGDRLPPEQALAGELGVAYMTLRRAINRLVERGVVERRPGVGTFVRSGVVSKNLALLIFNVRSLDAGTLPARELEILQDVAGADGRQVRGMLMLEPLPSPGQIVSELSRMGVGAAGLLGFLNSDADFIGVLATEMPCVLFNKPLPGVNLPYAAPDTLGAARQMVEHFRQTGRSRVGFANLNTQHALYNELSFAIESELHRAGMPVDKSFWFEAERYGDEPAIGDWLSERMTASEGPDAFVLPSREAARRTCRNLHDKGRRLSIDFELIVTYSGSDAEQLGDPWPCMELNYADAARAASQMLLDIVDREKEDTGILVCRSTPRLVLPKRERR